MKTIFVTGGLGFIGSNFIKKNISKYRIINIDKVTYASNKKYLKDISTLENYKFYKLDINQTNKISKLIKIYNPTYIFNFAAESHVDNSITNSNAFMITNILGTHSLLKAVLANKKKLKNNFKFIHISTDEVFGDVKNNKFTKEIDKYHPSSPYSSSKASADHLVTAWGRTYDINYNITYSSNNFGPNQHKEKFIPVVINSIMQNKIIPIYGDGQQKREWIYVEDNNNGILSVAEKGKKNETYNIGSNNSLTNIKLAKKICELMVKNYNFDNKINKLIKHVKDRLGHDRNYSLDTSKIKKLKWKCKFNFDESLLNTIKWYINE